MTLQCLDGCPNGQSCHQVLVQALRSLGLPETVTLQSVATVEDADTLGFRDSRTVLVDGTDPFADSSGKAAALELLKAS
ncbi:MAG: hypothetical protein H7233_16330 [Pseudorhodobacter sp.]|nr:hypothetical protein [Frankiaceae bacterium]